MDNWWTTVLWSGSTKWRNRFLKHFWWFALKYFFDLHIKSLITLKIFGATFGIEGGGQLPPLPPLATRLSSATWKRSFVDVRCVGATFVSFRCLNQIFFPRCEKLNAIAVGKGDINTCELKKLLPSACTHTSRKLQWRMKTTRRKARAFQRSTTSAEVALPLWRC